MGHRDEVQDVYLENLLGRVKEEKAGRAFGPRCESDTVEGERQGRVHTAVALRTSEQTDREAPRKAARQTEPQGASGLCFPVSNSSHPQAPWHPYQGSTFLQSPYLLNVAGAVFSNMQSWEF